RQFARPDSCFDGICGRIARGERWLSSSSSFEWAREAGSPTLHRLHERHVDDVFGDEPYLQLVAANPVADEQVVRAIVSRFGGAPRHRASFPQHDLVGMQQA